MSTWTKAKNIKQGETINTQLGPKLVLESFKLPHMERQAITVFGTAHQVTFYFPGNELLERIGPTAATLRKEKTTHRASMEHPGFTMCLKRTFSVEGKQLVELHHSPSCEKCWWSR